MAVTAEHLREGGSVFYKIQIPRPGAQSEIRLKAARVLDIERGAATIRLLEEQQTRKVRFSNLEPDIDYLASLETSKRPLTHSMRSYLKAVELDNVRPLPGPVENEQAAAPAPADPPPTVSPAEPPPPAPVEPPPPAQDDDVQAYLEIGKDLRTRLDKQILTAPPAQVAALMRKRAELESQIVNAKQASTKDTQTMAEPKNMRGLVKYSAETKAEALAAVDAGTSARDAAVRFKVSYKTLCVWISKHEVEKQLAAKRERKRAADKKSPTKLASTGQGLGARYSPETKAEVLASIDDGLTWLEAATKFKVGYSTVRTWALEHRAAKKTAVAVGRGNRHSADTKALVIDAVDSGMEWSEAAQKFKVPYSTVRTWAHVERPTHAERAANKPPTSTGIVIVSGDDSTTLRENKRLRLTLAALLQRSDPGDTPDKLTVQNQRLQVVIDLLLGVE